MIFIHSLNFRLFDIYKKKKRYLQKNLYNKKKYSVKYLSVKNKKFLPINFLKKKKIKFLKIKSRYNPCFKAFSVLYNNYI